MADITLHPQVIAVQQAYAAAIAVRKANGQMGGSKRLNGLFASRVSALAYAIAVASRAGIDLYRQGYEPAIAIPQPSSLYVAPSDLGVTDDYGTLHNLQLARAMGA